MANVLIVAQAIGQWYVDTLTNALGKDAHIDIITGSNVKGNIITSPAYDPSSLKSRFKCWIRHYRFVKNWVKNNKNRHYELIFIISNPPINAYVGLKLKKIYHAPLVFMNWDLYPQVIEYGINNTIAKLVSKFWHNWNKKNYPKIDQMLTIGDVMVESINNDLKNPIPIKVIPISVDTKYLTPRGKVENSFAQKYNLVDKFVVLYSGKMGLGHNIELILKASTIIEKEYDDIKFVFIGQGPKYKVIDQYIKEHNSSNILLLPYQPKEIFPMSMSCGDIGIVSQEAKMAHLFMPSKTYSMMACGQAIIGISSEHDDLKNLIENCEIGYCISNNSVTSLVGKIIFLYKNPDVLQNMKQKARKVIENEYSIDVIENQYALLFNNLLNSKD